MAPLLTLPFLAAPPALAAKTRSCSAPAYGIAGFLRVRGDVSCRAADSVIQQAQRKPVCQSHGERGCTGTTRVSAWTCKGLFPGEGFDLVCTSRGRWIHGAGGG
ncbi:MAG: hypothetical protein V9E83_04605 [Baekduia sp.]